MRPFPLLPSSRPLHLSLLPPVAHPFAPHSQMLRFPLSHHSRRAPLAAWSPNLFSPTSRGAVSSKEARLALCKLCNAASSSALPPPPCTSHCSLAAVGRCSEQQWPLMLKHQSTLPPYPPSITRMQSPPHFVGPLCSSTNAVRERARRRIFINSLCNKLRVDGVESG